MSDDRRADFIAFQTFLAELASIPTRITEPAMGEIRLQWWHDVVSSAGSDNNFNGDRQNIGPLASALQAVQTQHGLPSAILQQIIESRSFDLYNDPMPDLESFETYAGETEALAMMLSAQILVEDQTQLSGLCGHAAMAICLADHLFGWPKTAQKQKLFLPKSYLSQQGVTPDDWFTNSNGASIRSAILDLCSLAEDHHTKALQHFYKLPKGIRAKLTPAFLRLAPTKLMIEKRKKQPMGLLYLSNWRAFWRIWRMAASG